MNARSKRRSVTDLILSPPKKTKTNSASGQQTPCVGVSIGVERVLTIMEQRKQQQAQQELAAQGRRRSPFVEVGSGWVSCRLNLDGPGG